MEDLLLLLRLIRRYGGVNVKEFYLLLNSKALRTFSLSSLVMYLTKYNASTVYPL